MFSSFASAARDEVDTGGVEQRRLILVEVSLLGSPADVAKPESPLLDFGWDEVSCRGARDERREAGANLAEFERGVLRLGDGSGERIGGGRLSLGDVLITGSGGGKSRLSLDSGEVG